MEFFHNNSKRSSQCTWKSWHIIIKKHKLFCIHGITLHLVKFLLPRTDHIPRNFFFKSLSCGSFTVLKGSSSASKVHGKWLISIRGSFTHIIIASPDCIVHSAAFKVSLGLSSSKWLYVGLGRKCPKNYHSFRTSVNELVNPTSICLVFPGLGMIFNTYQKPVNLNIGLEGNSQKKNPTFPVDNLHS